MVRRVRAWQVALLVIWGAVCILPLYWMFLTSIKSNPDFMNGPRYLPFVDFVPDLQAWRYVLLEAEGGFYWRLGNSLLIAVSATLLALAFGTMAVYGATRLPTRQRWLQDRYLVAAMVATRILPPIAVALPLYVLGKVLHLLDTHVLLILVYAAAHIPVVAWLALPVIGTKRSEQEEAALLEGVSHFLIFRTILLPMAAAGLMAIAAIVFVLCWNEYLFAVVLTTDHALTLPPFLMGQMSVKEAQAGAEVEEWGRFSAATIIMVLPVMALTGAALAVIGKQSFIRRG